MKILFFKITGFVLLIICTLFIIEILIRHIPNDYKYKKNYLDNNSDSIEILFLGASEFHSGLNPVYTTKRSFNASHPAQTMDYCFALLDKYNDNWLKLDYIVLAISYPTLYMKLEDSWEGWRVKNYNIYYDIPLSKRITSEAEIFNGRLFDHLLRLYDYYIRKIDPITCSDLGWFITSTTEPPDSLYHHGIVAAKGHTIPPEQHHFNEMRSALDSIIDFSSRKRCQLILCTTPVYKSYRENLNRAQLDSTINTVTGIIEKKNNCTYVNLMDSKDFTDEDFFDGNHLNGNGARKLTLIIDSIINYIDIKEYY